MRLSIITVNRNDAQGLGRTIESVRRHAPQDREYIIIDGASSDESVGIIDRYFPNAALFLESERFDRHIYRLSKKDKSQAVDYISICSPNYLHDAHVRLALS